MVEMRRQLTLNAYFLPILSSATPERMDSSSAALLYVTVTSTKPAANKAKLCVVSPRYHATCEKGKK